MKKISTLLSALLLFSGAYAAPRHGVAFAKKAPEASVRLAEKRAALRAGESETRMVYLPLVETLYAWDFDTNEWIEVTEYHNTYDQWGQLVAQESWDVETGGQERVRSTFTYNAAGRVLSRTEESSTDFGTTWAFTSKLEREFDSKVPTFIISNLSYRYEKGAWLLNYGNKYPVTRNEQGVVVKVERTANIGDEFTPIARINNYTTDDGKTIVRTQVSEFKSDETTGNLYWDDNVDIRNIEWAATDGQLMVFDINALAMDEENRIASGELFYFDEYDGSVSGTYAANGDRALTVNFPDDSRMIISRVADTDAGNGSYTEKTEIYYTEDGEDVYEYNYYTVHFDDHGNIAEEIGGLEINNEVYGYESNVYEYTYNADGAAEQTIIKYYDPDEDALVNDTRIDASDFKAFAGIDAPEANSQIAIAFGGHTLAVAADGASSVDVISFDGRAMATAAGHDAYEVDLGRLTPGIYIAIVRTATEVKSLKLVKSL